VHPQNENPGYAHVYTGTNPVEVNQVTTLISHFKVYTPDQLGCQNTAWHKLENSDTITYEISTYWQTI